MREQDETTHEEARPERRAERGEQSSPDHSDGGRPVSAQPTAQTTPESRAETDGGEDRAPLFASEDTARFRQRWDNLQTGFVDEPRRVVEEADDLVGELMQQLTSGFSEKRSNLEAQWEQGDEVSTEELRVALTRYRSFFNRLLSA
jgi:hypothetical protein